MKYIVEILQQFTMEQRFLVLIVLLAFISGTYIITSYLKSPQKSCHELMELNQKYVQDFINISDMIRKNKLKEVTVDTVSKPTDIDSTFESEDSPEYGEDSVILPVITIETEDVFDSILKITDDNLKIKK